MRYLKCLLFNFLIVFFVDYLVPGIDVVDQTKIPHIGGDLLFAGSLGLLNALAFPALRLIRKSSGGVQLAIFLLILNFAAFGLLKIIAMGIFITSLQGYLIAVFVVSLGSFFLNYPWGKKPRETAPSSKEEAFHEHHEEEQPPSS